MLRLDTPPARLRTTTLLEGVSYLVLVFVAVPLKHLAGEPLAVRVVGPVHGALFLAMCWLLWRAVAERGRSVGWAARIVLLSLVPFGAFALERGLRADERAHDRAQDLDGGEREPQRPSS
jgi:integral membrane protein